MSFLTKPSLGKKIAFMAAVGILAGVGVFWVLSMQALDQSTDAMLDERLTTTHLIADYTDEVLGNALNELKNTARTIEIDGVGGEIDPQIKTLEDTYSRMSISTLNIFVLDKEGRVMWSKSGYPELADVDMSTYSSVSQTLESGEASTSGLVSAPVTQTPAILLTSATKEGQQGATGALVVAIDLAQSSIGGFIQPIKLGQTGYVEIVDQKGIVIARTKPGRELAPFEKSDHPDRFAELISAGEPTVGTCHTCHEAGRQVEKKDVLAFAPLSRVPWGVVIRQSEDEALAPTRELRQRLLFAGGGLLAIALLFVAITTRDIVKRIRTLSAASERIADGDLVTPVTALGKDEIGTLARTFDGMRTKLKTYYDELEQRTRELSSLLAVSGILTSARDLSSLLDAVVAKAVEVIPGAEGGALLLQSADQDEPVVQSVAGLNAASLSQPVSTSGGEALPCSIPEQVDEEIKGLAKEMCAAFLQSDAVRSQAQSAICAPVVCKDQCIGSIIMVSSRDRAFSESDISLLQAIADDIALAVDRAQLAKEAEEARALREADRLKSQFISSVSHELRTPLTSIKGYSSSLLRQDVSWDEETEREFLQTIDDKTDELRGLPRPAQGRHSGTRDRHRYRQGGMPVLSLPAGRLPGIGGYEADGGLHRLPYAPYHQERLG